MSNKQLDIEYLAKIVDAVKLLSDGMPKQMLAVKDVNSVYIICSDYLAEMIGVKPSEIEGKRTWPPMYGNSPEFEEIIFEEDQLIMRTRESRLALKVSYFKEGLRPFSCFKAPIINPETNNVVGVYCCGVEVGHISFTKTMRQIIDGESAHQDVELPHLSRREKQVVFFFMANLSSAEIAKTLGEMEGKSLSKSTVDSIFNDQLYMKFGVYSRPELYSKLQSLGYERLIPTELLKNTSLLVATMQSY